MNWQELIESQPTLGFIPPGLRGLAERIRIAAGTTLFRVGDPVEYICSVITGEVRLVRRDRNGTEIVLQRARRGFFAEASLGAGAYHCDASITGDGELVRFPAQAFHAAFDQDAAFRNAWMAHLAREVRRLRAQCERLSLHGAGARIVHYIESEGRADAITLDQTRKAWAAELGLTHEALYRALRRLQADGTLRVDGNRIAIVRPGPA